MIFHVEIFFDFLRPFKICNLIKWWIKYEFPNIGYIILTLLLPRWKNSLIPCWDGCADQVDILSLLNEFM